MDESSKGIKRMRKGTKSCLPCRRRKTRCSLPGPNGGSCAECVSRGERCTAQGFVGDDNINNDILSTNQRLKKRVAQLEARLQQLLPQDVSPADPSPTPISIPGTLSSSPSLLLSLPSHPAICPHAAGNTHQASLSPSSSAEETMAVAVAEADPDPDPDPDEPSLETSTSAPLMRLLANPILGGTSTSPSPSPTPVPPSHPHAPSQPSSSSSSPALLALRAALPPPPELHSILTTSSSWWPLYRSALGLEWGEDSAPSAATRRFPTLASFAHHVLSLPAPPVSLLGLLLAGLAISTGEPARFLPAVERWVLGAEARFAGAGPHAWACLMAVGLAWLAALRPRRAWEAYRRGNAGLLVAGLHRRRVEGEGWRESVFWQFFHADRWCSLMIGMPYGVADHFCDTDVGGIGELGPATWLYRRLAVLTGRVVDCLQHVRGPALAAALEVEEQMAEVRAQLPEGYLSLGRIGECGDAGEKVVRLYRVVHFCLLRAYVHLPFLLRSALEGGDGEGRGRYEYSRRSCIDDARQLLEAYLMMADDDAQAVYDGTVLNFNAFTAAVIILLGLMGYGQSQDVEQVSSSVSQVERDWKAIYRVMEVLRQGAECKIAALLCKTCFEALQSLVANARGVDGEDGPRKVVLPYFGTIEITRRSPIVGEDASQQIPPGSLAGAPDISSAQSASHPMDAGAAPLNANFGVDFSFAYHGHFLPETSGFGNEFASMDVPMSGSEWIDGLDVNGPDWDWLNADIPSLHVG